MTAPQPPQDYLPPDAPATVDDVRATRRWTWVAFAWAVAASIVAVLALIQASNNDSTDTQQSTNAQDAAAQIRQFEQQTNDRLDQFGRRLDDTASKTDVEKLDKSVSQVQDDVAKLKTASSDQSDSIKQLQTDLDDLTKRVDQLEQQQQQQGQSQTP